VYRSLGTTKVTINLEGAPGTTIDLPASGIRGADPVGLITRLEHRLAELETRKAKVLADIDHACRQMTHARSSIGQPFQHAAELAAARTRARGIDEALDRMARDNTKRAEAAAGQEAGDASGHREPGAPPAETDTWRETYPQSGAHVSAQREQANRAAVAANEAYRAGDLDQAGRLVDQAAALDPSRADLWQQHRDQITARRLILDAQVAHADADHQRAQRLIDDARQLDPRMPAVWDSDLLRGPRTQPARQINANDASASRPRGNVEADRSADQESRATTLSRSGTATQGDRQSPSWPSSPGRGQPQRPAVIQQVDGVQPGPQEPLAGGRREPSARSGASADVSHTSTQPAGSDPAARWPAPNPRALHQSDLGDQEAKHGEAADQESLRRQQAHHPSVPAEPSGTAHSERSATPSADWRDDVLNQARQPWQPAPSWPHHPAMHRPPEVDTPDVEIEPRY
jgi:hypothetical protein